MLIFKCIHDALKAPGWNFLSFFLRSLSPNIPVSSKTIQQWNYVKNQTHTHTCLKVRLWIKYDKTEDKAWAFRCKQAMWKISIAGNSEYFASFCCLPVSSAFFSSSSSPGCNEPDIHWHTLVIFSFIWNVRNQEIGFYRRYIERRCIENFSYVWFTIMAFYPQIWEFPVRIFQFRNDKSKLMFVFM